MFIVRRIMCSYIWKQVRTYSVKPKNHYESLGIHPNSTQGEVKNAYYKLSMVYHPDKNEGNTEYAEKFREITAAYEVLGNIKSRKMYDRGLHIGINPFPQDDTPHSKFHQSRATRSRPPTASGRVPIYDFDEWSKNHYGDLLRKKVVNKKRTVDYWEFKQDEKEILKKDYIYIAILFIIFAWIVYHDEKRYDRVVVGKKTED